MQQGLTQTGSRRRAGWLHTGGGNLSQVPQISLAGHQPIGATDGVIILDAIAVMRSSIVRDIVINDTKRRGTAVPTSTPNRRAFGLLAAGAIGLLAARPARAALAAPKGRAILTVSGKIHITNDGATAKFDRDMLEALGMTSFATKTPWYDKVVTFEGPLMTSLMDAVGAYGENVVATALNDYSTTIPVADFAQYKPILALKRDGQYLPVRDKGPLFMVYNYDSNPELRQQKYYGRSAWQVAQLSLT